MHPCQAIGADDDTGLLGSLADRRIGRFFSRIDDAGDRGQRVVVGASTQQDLTVTDDDSGDADEGERARADEAAQLEDEVGSGHTATVSAAEQEASRQPRRAGSIGVGAQT